MPKWPDDGQDIRRFFFYKMPRGNRHFGFSSKSKFPNGSMYIDKFAFQMSITQDLVMNLGNAYQRAMAAIGRSDPMMVAILATLATILALLIFVGCPCCLRSFFRRRAEAPQGSPASQSSPTLDNVETGVLNDNNDGHSPPQAPPGPPMGANAPGSYHLEGQYQPLDDPQAQGSNKDPVSSPRPARPRSWESSNVSNSPPATPTTGMTNMLSFSFALPPLPPPPDFRNLNQSPAIDGMGSLLEQLRVGSGAAAQARLKPVSPPK